MPVDNVLKWLMQWLQGSQSPVAQEVAGLSQAVTDIPAEPLPSIWQKELCHQLTDLSLPVSQQQWVQDQVRQVWHQSQSGPMQAQGIVLLAEPVEPTAAYLAAVLDPQVTGDWPVVDLLHDWNGRPQDHKRIAERLSAALDAQLDCLGESGPPRATVVVRAVEWCFLRSTGGLAGIEWLRQTMLEHPNWIWVLGCNRWAWHYLNRVCQLDACCEQHVRIPALSSEDLRDWLGQLPQGKHPANPTSSDPPDASHGDGAEDSDPAADGWKSRQEQAFFEKLAEQSQGIGRVAGRLWVRSQHLPTDTPPPQPDQPTAIPPKRVWHSPEPPALPKLTTDERYLLFSLLLHGSLSLSHLALSLADDPRQVHAQVQHLSHQGLVDSDLDQLQINPTYYLALQNDLKANNFYIGGVDPKG